MTLDQPQYPSHEVGRNMSTVVVADKVSMNDNIIGNGSGGGGEIDSFVGDNCNRIKSAHEDRGKHQTKLVITATTTTTTMIAPTAAHEAGSQGTGRSDGGRGGIQSTDHDNIDSNNNSNTNNCIINTLKPGHSTQSPNTSTTTANSSATSKAFPHNNEPTKTTMATEAIKGANNLSQVRKTSTAGRFKEKRPEPLKLNQNPNQEIPLDLSVKSAGNAPSGGVFNLSNPNFNMATLETPRIQWEDTGDLLMDSTKGNIFSTATHPNNRSKLSSSIGDSPPITPSSPYPPTMAARSASHIKHPVGFVKDSSLNNNLITSPLQLMRYHQLRHELRTRPRRSCSSDNLDQLVTGVKANQDETNTDNKKWTKLRIRQEDCTIKVTNDSSQSKKNSISPLAIKSLSSSNSTTTSEMLKFSYHNNNQPADSPTMTSINGKALTPTSVANATANFLNIHLNSPTQNSSDLSPTATMFEAALLSQQAQSQSNSSLSPMADYSNNRKSTETMNGTFDPMFSANCQRSSATTDSSSTTTNSRLSCMNKTNLDISTISDNHLTTSSIGGGSATLNTPNLISPSQLKAGHVCFLPSPTLSPMSSVFELPSPLMGFAQQTTQQNNQHNPHTSESISQTSSNTAINNNIGLAPTVSMASANTTIADNQAKPIISTTSPELVRGERTATVSSSSGNNNRASSDNNLNEQINVNPLVRNQVSSETDLKYLIMKADDKVQIIGSSSSGRVNSAGGDKENSNNNKDPDDDEIQMDIEGDATREISNMERTVIGSSFSRPATVIPQIHVSEGSLQSQCIATKISTTQTATLSQQPSQALSDQHINITSTQRDPQLTQFSLGKRSLSPKSFRNSLNLSTSERTESSSAPPDVHHRRIRSKIKTASGSCTDLESSFNDPKAVQKSPRNLPTGQQDQGQRFPLFDRPLIGSNTDTDALQNQLPSSNLAQPYPERAYIRSNSAEPRGHRLGEISNNTNGQQPEVLGGNNLSQSAHHLQSAFDTIIKPSVSIRNNNAAATSGVATIANGQHPGSRNQSKHLDFSPQAHTHSISAGDLHRFCMESRNAAAAAAAAAAGQSSFFVPPAAIGLDSLTDKHQLQEYHHHHSHQYGQYHPLGSSLDNLIAHNYQQQQLSKAADKSRSHGVPILHSANLTTDSRQQQQLHHQHQQHHLQQHPQHQHVNDAIKHGIYMLPPSVANNKQSAVSLFGSSNQRAYALASNYMSDVGGAQTAVQSICGPIATTTMSSASIVKQPLFLATTTTGGTTSTLGNCSNSIYPVDISDLRSETASSNSLDFCSFTPNSRSSSVASGSLTASNGLEGAKRYHCDLCSKSFTRSDMLTRHKRLHSGDRPFQCNECKQEFSRSDHLSTHMRTHTGEKPYKCKLCSYSACRKDMITRHMKVHNRSPTSPTMHPMELN